MPSAGLKQLPNKYKKYCDSRLRWRQRQRQTQRGREPAAKQFVSPPSNLSSKANVLQFVNKKISLRLGPVCSRSVFASASLPPNTPPNTCLHCLCCCFVCCLHSIGYLSVSVSVSGSVLVCLACLALTCSLFFLSFSPFLWQLLCK